MQRLTAETLGGIWAGVTMVWDEQDRFDTDVYAQNIESLCDAGVHGIYTTGSTGEFYVLTFEEFAGMVDIQAEICGKRQMPLQIGCCADHTRQTIRLLEYAASKPQVGAAQVNIPYWMELSDRELDQFFTDIHAACPDLPLVHYNIPRSKRFLGGADYRRLLEVAPTLIGVKYTFAGSHFADLAEAMLLTPQLSYFVGESLLASAMQLGVRGCYSSLVCTDPAYMLRYYDHAVNRCWDEAITMQQQITRFGMDVFAFIQQRNEGVIDPVFDKGLGVASGCLAGSQRTRPPYIGWTDETVAALGQWLGERYPMFCHPRRKG